MPERNREVVIDGYVFPDTVTVRLANEEYINSRDYVSKELYESVCGANDAWQTENARLLSELESVGTAAYLYGRGELKAENAKLRELLSSYWKRVHSSAAPNVERDYLAEMRELGIEVGL